MKRMRQRGFTLTEILIALFILSFVLLSLSAMVISVMRATAQSKGMAIATTLAQDKMESLKSLKYSSLTSGSDPVIIGKVTYDRRWTVSPSGNLKIIHVAVTWSGPPSHGVSLTTLRGN